MTRRIGFMKNINQSKEFFFLMTQRIELFFETWLSELNHFSNMIYWKRTLLSNMTHGKWTLLSNMTHRNWTFLFNMTLTNIWLKELNLFLSMSQRIELCSWQELNFFWEWLKDFVEYDSKNRTFFFLNITQRIELFLKICSKNCFFFFNMLHRIELMFSITSKMEHLRVWLKELNFSWNITWHKELNLLWNKNLPKELKLLFNMTQRIELFFKYSNHWFFFCWKNWTLSFSNTEQRIEPFFSDMTQRIEPFLFDSKTWDLFLTWLKDFHLLLNLVLNMTQWFEPFFYMTQRIELFFLSMTQRIELFFLNMTQRIELFLEYELKELNFFLNMNSKNWIFLNMTRRIEPFFSDMTQRIEPSFSTWLKELNPFIEHDSEKLF